MQVDKTDSLALFVLFILVLNSCVCGIVPCVSSQPWDMGFWHWQRSQRSQQHRGCSRSFWPHCWYCWGSFMLGRGAKLPWQDELKNSLVWCFGHKSECEPVGWALSHDLPDAVSVSSSCWCLLGSLGIQMHIPMVFCPTWYFCSSPHSVVLLQPRHP